MVTVTRDAAGRWFASFAVEQSVEALPLTGVALGVDVGLKDVLVTSAGEKSGNPKKLRGRLRHLKRLQRGLSRKTRGSNRYRRQQHRVARLHAKIVDSRRDWLHKQSTALVQSADVIAIEDLFVKGMLRNRHLALSLGDAGLGELRRQIEYKAGWYGRVVLTAGRFTPTSKTCSCCGHVLDELTLNTRRWVCPVCGTDHDRDINAARNILQFATAGRAGSGHDAQSAWSGKNPVVPAAQAVSVTARGEARIASGLS
ncbi:MAG: RNA-guided endonuclease InsQ/TnpB family protein [Gammaproteobacteria bacterium]